MNELTVDAIAGAGFRATVQSDEFSQEIRVALGFGSHNIPARLAIARSLAVPSLPPKADGESGRTIRGETLFGVGSDLLAWPVRRVLRCRTKVVQVTATPLQVLLPPLKMAAQFSLTRPA